jgi:hypothetical protein
MGERYDAKQEASLLALLTSRIAALNTRLEKLNDRANVARLGFDEDGGEFFGRRH